jgi:Spy/CpxP family protein refolding chaperone
MRTTCAALLFALVAAAPARAQHEHPAGHATAAGIKALTPAQVAELLAGEGMGLAKAAELNHYPGPKHVLELAAQLELSDAQLAKVRALREDVVAKATALGRTIIDKERELDALFAQRDADAAKLARLTNEIARLQGELRAAHLQAHIDTRAALTSAQIEAYDRLRGY